MTDERRTRHEEQREPEQPRVPIRDRRVNPDDPSSEEAEAAETGEGADAAEGGDTPPSGGDAAGQELEEAQQLAAERLDQLMRMKADFENYRKRVIREQTEIVERASLRVVEQLLGVLDDFERALDAAREHEGAEGFIRGMELVYTKLLDVLRAEGLEQVTARGEAFDPLEHEAIGSEPGNVSEPTVLEVVRPGYRMKGRTIRPALVHVTTPTGESEEDGSGSGEEGSE